MLKHNKTRRLFWARHRHSDILLNIWIEKEKPFLARFEGTREDVMMPPPHRLMNETTEVRVRANPCINRVNPRFMNTATDSTYTGCIYIHTDIYIYIYIYIYMFIHMYTYIHVWTDGSPSLAELEGEKKREKAAFTYGEFQLFKIIFLARHSDI